MSRLHKIGTIYTRIEGLIRNNYLKEVDKPIWFDVYTHFPPTYEPVYGRPAPKTEIKEILYEEDNLRIKLHEAFPRRVMNLESSNRTNARKWISLYKEYLEKGMSENEAIQKLGESLEVTQSRGKKDFLDGRQTEM